MRKCLVLAAAALPLQAYHPPPSPPKYGNAGEGVMVSLVPEPAIAVPRPPPFREPIIAVPQNGPGEAELSVWDSPGNRIVNIGRYESIPVCRIAKARLKLLADQKAYCTLAPGNHPGLDMNWRPPGER